MSSVVTIRSRLALLVGLAIDNFGTGLFLPLPLLYATREIGLGVGTAGAAVAVGTVVGFGVPPLAGRLTHRFGPRVAVVAALLVQSAGAVGYLLTTGVWGIFVAAGLMAAGGQTFYCSVSVLVADLNPDEHAKERPFAVVAMVRSAAFGVGNLVAALFLAALGDAALRALVAIDAVTFVVAAGILTLFVSVKAEHTGTVALGPLTVLRDRRYLALMVATCLLALAMDFALVGMPVFVVNVVAGPDWLPGALLSCLAVLSSVLGVRVVHLLRRHRRTWSLQVCAWLYAAWSLLSMLMIWLPGGWLVPFAFAVWLVMVAGNKIFFPVVGALSEAMPPRAGRAGYLATFQYAFTTAGVLAPALVALFEVSAWLPWAVVAAAAAGGVVMLARLGAGLSTSVDRPARPGVRPAATGGSARPTRSGRVGR